MTRKIVTMTPKQIEVREELSRFADVLMPGDAESPVLAPGPRAALFDWMVEINAADALAEVGVKPRRTALLYGPPGTGKTTFAWHFAARLGLPLACVRSESLIESWLGSTGRNIGSLFDAMARTEGDVVIFFDEFDALGGVRMKDQGASVERANSLTVLLRRIEKYKGIVLAATNRQDALDPAMWRRFDMQIEIALPDHDARFAILKRYAAPFVFADDDLDLLAQLSAGASPALLRALMEGVKRALVIWPRTRRRTDSAVPIFRAVLASVSMPPDFKAPLLWSDPAAAESLAGMTWPPALPPTAPDEEAA